MLYLIVLYRDIFVTDNSNNNTLNVSRINYFMKGILTPCKYKLGTYLNIENKIYKEYIIKIVYFVF